jgi:general secretion pathway protein D
MAISGFPTGADGALSSSATAAPIVDGKVFTGGTLADIQRVAGSLNALRGNLNFTIPTATYSLLKTYGNSELLANPELRISEGEKATLHIGQRIPVPVTTISGYNPGTTTGGGTTNQQLTVPYTSFQYQDVGIKVAMEPRVHHNREVTLKLTVEVSNQGTPVKFAGQEQPTFATRTIESTIRLKDGETNFLAGLIQSNKIKSATKTPILGDIPLIGRLFTNEHRDETRTDLVLTMTPHIVRIPDITEEDVAPMWVGTGNNLTFRGVSPRIESQVGVDPFAGRDPNAGRQLAEDGEPGNYIVPEAMQTPVAPAPTQGTAPSDPFRRPEPQPQPPPPNNPPEVQNPPDSQTSASSVESSSTALRAQAEPEMAALRLAPRVGPQPSTISLKPGESKVWNIVGMDLDGLTATEILLHFNPRAMDVTDVTVGAAIAVDPALPPVVTIDRTAGTIRVTSSNGKPLHFVGGGDVLLVRVHGGNPGDTFLVLQNPEFHTVGGEPIVAAVAGGRAKVQ